MTDVAQPVETEEQKLAREAQERDTRSRNALRSAPELIHHVRSIAIGGQAESGETLREWSAPMRITAADAADEVFAQLVDWRIYWEGVFDITVGRVFVASTRGKVATPDHWRNRRGEVQGFASGTSAELAQILTRVQTRVLLDRADDISQLPSAAVYQDDIAKVLGALSAQFPTNAPLDLTARDDSEKGKTEYLTDDAAVNAEIRLLLVKPYLLPSEVAILVRKSKRQINRMIADPDDPLPTYSYEGQKHVVLEEVRDWIETHPTRQR